MFSVRGSRQEFEARPELGWNRLLLPDFNAWLLAVLIDLRLDKSTDLRAVASPLLRSPAVMCRYRAQRFEVDLIAEVVVRLIRILIKQRLPKTIIAFDKRRRNFRHVRRRALVFGSNACEIRDLECSRNSLHRGQ